MPVEITSFLFSKPYGTAVVDWLLERMEELPQVLVLVPTAQSGRRLRQGLAERGALLAPRVVTTGTLMQMDGVAADSVEVLAWTEALESVNDWEAYKAIFPESPASVGSGWALGLAKAFVELRKNLQENGLMLSEAARQVSSLEHDRWEQLARLEREVENQLQSCGYVSKSTRLASGDLELPEGISRVVVAGVFDLPPVLTRFFEKIGIMVSVLVPDPRVDEWGRPGLQWNRQEIQWPKLGGVTLTGDPGQQAALAVAKVVEAESECNNVGLGTADEQVAAELVRSFARAGWVVHDPGASLPSSLVGWLSCWRRYIQNPSVKEVVDMLAFDQGGSLVEGIRSQQVEALSSLLDSHLVRDLSDVSRARELIFDSLRRANTESKRKRLDHQLKLAVVAEQLMLDFAALRKRFLSQGFHKGMRALAGRIDRSDEAGLLEWLDETVGAAQEVKRPPVFWIELLLQDLGPLPEQAPDGRVLDVQGWLELLHDPARHLVVCGMNEGYVPGRASSDTWLPESAREVLGLPCEESRAARDAYLLHALLEI